MEFISWRPSQVVQYGLAVEVQAEMVGSKGSGRTLNLRKREYAEMTILGLEQGSSYRWFLAAKDVPPWADGEGSLASFLLPPPTPHKDITHSNTR